ncbi:hypothetical protein D3C81_1465620 [compost metagenome]
MRSPGCSTRKGWSSMQWTTVRKLRWLPAGSITLPLTKSLFRLRFAGTRTGWSPWLTRATPTRTGAPRGTSPSSGLTSTARP